MTLERQKSSGVVFERDVAIQQLNELGIQFGEDIQKYKVVKS